jgi:tetrahydromethanopterin S-methyltransferase subunit G
MQRIVKDAAARVVADLAETTLKDGYIHFDERQSSQIGTIIRATVGVVPVDKVLPVKEQLEQLEAKVTCMCGDYVNHHSMEAGHSPVSMYDYSLSRAEEENERLKKRVEQLERRLEEVFP